MSRELTPQEIAERSLIKTYRKSLWNPFVAAVKRYELVSPGDHIAYVFPEEKTPWYWLSLCKSCSGTQNSPFP